MVPGLDPRLVGAVILVGTVGTVVLRVAAAWSTKRRAARTAALLKRTTDHG